MQQPNLKSDLLSCDWLKTKCQNDAYAQNLYAAMCNQEFQKQQVWTILKDEVWSCSWRGAGGIVADIRGSGDYLDWYCSGMGGVTNLADDDLAGDRVREMGYVPEGTVTDEIREDLARLGWHVVNENEQ